MTDLPENDPRAPADNTAHRPDIANTAEPDAPVNSPQQPYDQLDDQSAQVMRAMPEHGTATPEELATRSGLPLRVVLRRLPLLELAGLVHRRDGGVALTNGDEHADTSLSDLISAYCAANSTQPLKPYEIARGITTATGRHLGTAAVLNCCLLLASTGRLVQVAEAPIAFAFPNASTPADEDGTPQS